MKTFITGLLQSGITRWSLLAGVAAVLVWAWPATAGQKQAVEAVSVTLSFDPGQASATPGGNIHIKGMTAVNMLVSENPLFTGRLTWVGNFNGDAQLNGVGSGTGMFEVGTWDLSSGAPVFIPSPAGGLYVTTWQGQGNPISAYEVKVVGHGIAGEVAGMQFDVIGNGDLFSTLYSGELLDPHAEK